MKPETTLKELLKPPFTHDSIGMIYDDNSRFIDVPGLNFNKENSDSWQGEAIAKTRGWGVFQYFENGAQLQDEFMDFIVSALNEKWKQNSSEQLRWLYFYDESDDGDFMYHECEFTHIFQCGSCNFEVEYPDNDGIKPSIESYRFCPSCGIRLLPPADDKG